MTNFEKVKEFLKNVFRLRPVSGTTYDINMPYSFRVNAQRNGLWYYGTPYELQQFYSQDGNKGLSFWGAKESPNQEIRRFHVNIPALMVDALVNITAKDIEDVKFEDKKTQELWDELDKDNEFKSIMAKATKEALIKGDAVVRFAYDLDFSGRPRMEVIPGDRVDFVYKNGFMREILLYTSISYQDTDYVIEETYGYGYIKYKLFKDGKEVPLDRVPQTQGLEDVEFDGDFMLAVPVKFFDSSIFDGRGRSIYEGKSDSFDFCDEAISQWIEAMRASDTKTYIPENLLNKDPNTGAIMAPNPFDRRFISVAASMDEHSVNKIQVEQGRFDTAGYEASYSTALDLALQGIVSPSTLGIDVKKLDNAEAQREKEKCTLYTRAAILDELGNIGERIIQGYFDCLSAMYSEKKKEIEVSIVFGEYANPSFEALIEVMSNPNTPMSIEAKVEEIWGDSQSDEWKAEEVQRIKNERGIYETDMPALNEGMGDNDGEDLQ